MRIRNLDEDLKILSNIAELKHSFAYSIIFSREIYHIEKAIRKKIMDDVCESPYEKKKLIRLMHSSSLFLDDDFINSLLGIDNTIHEEADFISTVYSEEQTIYEPTDYNRIRDVLKAVSPKKEDVVYDLGSGYGKLAFYGASVYSSKFKGIEIVKKRVDSCDRIKKKNGFTSVSFINADAKQVDFSDGTIFYMFNPFCFSTLMEIIKKLRGIAEKKQIKIISYGNCTKYLDEQEGWIKKIDGFSLENTRIYVTV